MDVKIVRNHYPVGQGFFSSQQISYGNEKYTCVYDCGSVSKGGSRLLDKYVDYLRDTTEAIDLLVISHLDADHINGLKYILKKFKVKKIIIPYITLVQRIILVLEKSRNINGLNSGILRDDRSFIEYIINVSTEDGEEEFASIDSINIEISRDTEVVRSNSYTSTEEVSLNKSDSIWEFAYFSLYSGVGENMERKFVEYFKDQCSNILGYDIEDLNLEDFQRCKSDIKNAYKKVYEYMNNKYGIKKKDIFNNSSVILYSGPRNKIWNDHYPAVYYSFEGRRHIEYKYACWLHWDEYHRFRACRSYLPKWFGGPLETRFSGWLGTGDARLADPKNINEIKDKLGRKRLWRIQVVTVPHHGSKNNSNDDFFNIFCNPNLECIIHSDPNGRYNHPHRETLSSIELNGFIPILVTTDEISKYSEYIDISCW